MRRSGLAWFGPGLLEWLNSADGQPVLVHKSQLAGAMMIILGVAILLFLAGFVVSIILVILELLGVILGVALILGGIAMLAFRRSMWRGGGRRTVPAESCPA